MRRASSRPRSHARPRAPRSGAPRPPARPRRRGDRAIRGGSAMSLRIPHAMVILLLSSFAPSSPASGDSIDDYIRAEMAKRRIPGLVLAVAKEGAVVKMEAYGYANLEHEVPVIPDTVFELASVTKQFTATAIMSLVEDGKLQVDDPILWHLPRGPETWKGITVRHLLTHTSGLPGLEDSFKTLRAGGGRTNYTDG